jgi:hypothetical protein
MSDFFHPGETAQVRQTARVVAGFERYLGETVVVEGSLRFVDGYDMPMHPIRILADGMPLMCAPSALIKLPPGPAPTDLLDTTTPLKRMTWNDSPWKPRGVKA